MGIVDANVVRPPSRTLRNSAPKTYGLLVQRHALGMAEDIVRIERLS